MSNSDVEALVLEYLRLARLIARKFAGRIAQLEDLEQVAALGLVKAARAFDPTRKVPFEAFARQRIVGELSHYVRDHEDVVRVPRSLRAQGVELRRAEVSALGVFRFGESNDLAYLPAREPVAIADRVVLAVLVEQLPERTQTVLATVLAGATQAEAGRRVGVSQTQISKIVRRGLDQLREAIA